MYKFSILTITTTILTKKRAGQTAELEINFYLPATQPSKNPALLLTCRATCMQQQQHGGGRLTAACQHRVNVTYSWETRENLPAV